MNVVFRIIFLTSHQITAAVLIDREKKKSEKCRLTFSGPNDITVFKDDADLVDLPAKLVARYSAKVSLCAALCLT